MPETTTGPYSDEPYGDSAYGATSGAPASAGTNAPSPVTLSASNLPTIVSQVTDAGYVFPQGAEMIGLSINTSQQLLAQPGTDYIYPGGPTISLPLTVEITNGSQSPWLEVGQIVDLSYEYTSQWSRANPTSNILNTVDIFINGSVAQAVTEEFSWYPPPLGQYPIAFTTANRYQWIMGNGQPPPAGDFYLPLLQNPLISIISLSIGSTNFTILPSGFGGPTQPTFISNGYYAYPVFDNTVTKGQSRSLDGIGVRFQGEAETLSGTAGICVYTCNSLPATINDLIQNVTPIGTNSQVHQATLIPFQVTLVISYAYNANAAAINGAISLALANYFSSIPFNGAIYISDILEQVMGVAGVQNARLATIYDVPQLQTLVLFGSNPNQHLGNTAPIQVNINGAVIDLTIEYPGPPSPVWNGLASTDPNVFAFNQAIGAVTSPTVIGNTVVSIPNITLLESLGEVFPYPYVFTYPGRFGPLTFTLYTTPGSPTSPPVTLNNNITNYGLQILSPDGTTVLSSSTTDYYLSDNQLPVFNNVSLIPRAQNSFFANG